MATISQSLGMLSYDQARQSVIDEVSKKKGPRATAPVHIWDAVGYVLAQEIKAEREYPPFDRATRDGYAVRAFDAQTGATLRCAGELKAGDDASNPLARWTCVQIMTGAGVPPGADAVVMVEHTARKGDNVNFDRTANSGQNIVPKGSEAHRGQVVLAPGARFGFAEVALAAQVGATEPLCAVKPRVAILSTGDEVVLVEQKPGPFQIRNSNSVSLAAQTRGAGGEPVLLGNARDRADELRAKIERGLREDILVISGGVSAGKYDLVESVLKSLGAEIFFDAVAIRPGKPAVFARCKDKFVFGLPGNPVSTMVTFELLVRPAIDLLNGTDARPLPLLRATLAAPLKEKPGLTRFLPARIEWQGTDPQVTAIEWRGSGDVAALAKSNCFLILPADREDLPAGESVPVLLRKDIA
jgi:molybdopterin molybdotransferase